jgi:membrane dipeptidase
LYKIIDAHCDTASELLDRRKTLKNFDGMINLSMMKEYESYIQIFAAWISKESKNPKQRAVDILNKAKQEMKENNIKLILSYHDLKDVEGLGGILAIEDARALCGSLDSVGFFYDLGVRAITLAWNDDNEVTAGVKNTDRNAGLTDFGEEVVREMNKKGMIVDVSHITEKGFWDVLNVSKAPVMSSHSNCFSVCSHRRNLKDEQIKALVSTGGIMGINLYPLFLENHPEKASAKSVIRHIDHALSLGAEENICFGADFDGIDLTAEDLKNASCYMNLIHAMKEEGYGDELIERITHKNFMQFMKKVN